MAEALLRQRLLDQGIRANVSSAGLYPSGSPATDHGIEVMGRRGLDTSGHVSRQLDRQMVAQADLILGMARQHVREVAVLDPGALARTFTLKELAASARGTGARQQGESLDQWLARVSVGRRRDALLGAGHDDAFDVADPIGGTKGDYEVTADELDGLLQDVVRFAWPVGLRDAAQERTA
jgi:protein-tyrosine phosphatase